MNEDAKEAAAVATDEEVHEKSHESTESEITVDPNTTELLLVDPGALVAVNASKEDEFIQDEGVQISPLAFKQTKAFAVLEAEISDDKSLPQLPIPPPALPVSVLPVSVTAARKEELLLLARADRLNWIQQVPLPYREITDRDDPWSTDARLRTLKDSHVGNSMPSALSLLSHLYGIDAGTVTPNDVARRIEPLLLLSSTTTVAERSKALPTGQQRRERALERPNGGGNNMVLLRAYHEFIARLSDPAVILLVQAVRSFCRGCSKSLLLGKDAWAAKLTSFVESTMDAMVTQALWKDQDMDWMRRSLESFLYGQLHAPLERLLWTTKAQELERDWRNRLDSLQFVSPKHLEIACLENIDKDVSDVLQEPVAALVSLDAYYSPYEKLQRVLAVYHGVNAALSKALNDNNNENRSDSTSSESQPKLPSADDVLPAIILTVLCARPDRLLFNLQFIEDLLPSEFLRGEAGYAYTNLYGAVQFLRDLNLSKQDDEPTNLSMTADEFREGLAESRAAAQERLDKKAKKCVLKTIDSSTEPVATDTVPIIPVGDIRAARLRGDVVDVDWAVQWHVSSHGASIEPLSPVAQSAAAVDPMAGLPLGFSRNYTFLSTRPEDIKLSDLGQLLHEYRMLVHATETLIGERVSKASAERKNRMLEEQETLYERARQIDPSMLPTVAPSSGN